ncbi:hypothetical protein CLOSCI_00577 [[Clostridium] scindens ATCC 35704]|jgi:hypothetical protein|nr:hypothetical protein CLOSCI_00577 [[Clostridium] scindens ATCC 35704]
MEYEKGNTAAAFVHNTNCRIDKSLIPDPHLLAVYEVLQEELSKALRIIDNAQISK